jgi:NAD(P)-dependent dehydrogenase (short-subunit alcohol dehydrogenase family)
MSRSWVLITGASRGLGAHLATSFWNKGWNLALVARNQEALLQVCNDLPKRSEQKTIIFQCDLNRTTEVTSLVKKITDQLPRLDALINNAAIHGPIGPHVENNLMLWNETIQVNLMAPVALCHGLIDFITNSGGGSIINLSGGGATSPRVNFTAYASAKTALVRFSETLAQELIKHKIRVNCIAPGAMKTTLLEEVIVSGKSAAGIHEFEIAEKVFAQNGSSMNKVSDLALFLASDVSLGVTGKLVSAIWDNWKEWPNHTKQLQSSDAYTLRRIFGRERGMGWGDL